MLIIIHYFSVNAEKLMEYFKASMPNITQEKPQTEDDSFETRLQERTLQENIDFITKIGTLYNDILRIARNLLETRENTKIESHPFYHIIYD